MKFVILLTSVLVAHGYRQGSKSMASIVWNGQSQSIFNYRIAYYIIVISRFKKCEPTSSSPGYRRLWLRAAVSCIGGEQDAPLYSSRPRSLRCSVSLIAVNYGLTPSSEDFSWNNFRLIKMFDYGRCGCIVACSERLPKGEIIQDSVRNENRTVCVGGKRFFARFSISMVITKMHRKLSKILASLLKICRLQWSTWQKSAKQRIKKFQTMGILKLFWFIKHSISPWRENVSERTQA